MIGRPKGVYVNLGNLFELIAAGLACWGVWRLAGFGWALITAAVLLVAAAELIVDGNAQARVLPLRSAGRRLGAPPRWLRAVWYRVRPLVLGDLRMVDYTVEPGRPVRPGRPRSGEGRWIRSGPG